MNNIRSTIFRALRRRNVHLGALAALLLVASCGGTSGPTDPTYCFYDSECASGYCGESGTCASRCSTTNPCDTALVCEPIAAGSPVCVTPCPAPVTGFACVAGAHVQCSAAGDGHCAECGCPSNLRCGSAGSCVPLSNVGGECTADSDCATGNCSSFAGVCRVPIGQACDTTNCDLCVTSTGFAFCSRECSSNASCNGFQCLGSVAQDYFTCRPSCSSFSDPSCPGTCQYPSGGTSTSLFCSCPNCTSTPAPRGDGDSCRSGSECASGDCFVHTWTENNFDTKAFGFCTSTCSTNADCDDGTQCVNVPCGAGETAASCGNKCLRPCTDSYYCDGGAGSGTCHALNRVGASGTAMVCDAKLADGSLCGYSGAFGCISGRCVVGNCAPAAGVANGGACASGPDCASGTCTSGTCRGSGLIGSSCSVVADCQVGTCCFSGANAQHCASTCN